MINHMHDHEWSTLQIVPARSALHGDGQDTSLTKPKHVSVLIHRRHFIIVVLTYSGVIYVSSSRVLTITRRG